MADRDRGLAGPGGAAGLAEDAPATRLKGSIEALRAGTEQQAALAAELAALKAQVQEEEAGRAVEAALAAGKISPAQRSWALMYCRQDREGFDAYVAKAPKLVPVGEKLLLAREATPEPGGLAPEERAICRAMNISPETYLKAKAEIGQLTVAPVSGPFHAMQMRLTRCVSGVRLRYEMRLGSRYSVKTSSMNSRDTLDI